MLLVFEDKIRYFWSLGPEMQTMQKDCLSEVLFEGTATLCTYIHIY